MTAARMAARLAGPAAGATGRGIFAESHVPELLSGQDGTNGTSSRIVPVEP